MKIGIDIVENKRLQNKSPHFVDLVLTKKEQELYKVEGISFLSGRFACKEAVMKCLPNTKELSFLDIEILRNEDGSPSCSIPNVEVSISHDENYTVAMAIRSK